MNCSHNTIHQLFLNAFAKRAWERESESERERKTQCQEPSFPQNAILKIDYRLGSTDPLEKKTNKKWVYYDDSCFS